MSLLNLNVY